MDVPQTPDRAASTPGSRGRGRGVGTAAPGTPGRVAVADAGDRTRDSRMVLGTNEGDAITEHHPVTAEARRPRPSYARPDPAMEQGIQRAEPVDTWRAAAHRPDGHDGRAGSGRPHRSRAPASRLTVRLGRQRRGHHRFPAAPSSRRRPPAGCRRGDRADRAGRGAAAGQGRRGASGDETGHRATTSSNHVGPPRPQAAGLKPVPARPTESTRRGAALGCGFCVGRYGRVREDRAPDDRDRSRRSCATGVLGSAPRVTVGRSMTDAHSLGRGSSSG